MQGRCLCGDVIWQSKGPLELTSHCHCSLCRKSHGAPFATLALTPLEGFRWLRGREGLCSYESSPGLRRPFCGRCGSVVAAETGEDRVAIPLGCLEGDPGVRALAHIFVGSKAPWYEIADTLPRFEAYPPGWAVPSVPKRPRSAARVGAVGGSCLCGAVAYEINGGLAWLRSCHCSRCRRARSAAHATNGFASPERFRWLRGESHLAQYDLPDAERFANVFCRICGSCLPRVDASRGYVLIPAGSLDDDPGGRVREHIFVASKAPWFEIEDQIPRFEAYPPR
ncbi:MAG: GFA family protein [Myxococcota bacterium]